jgi:hypothetical protein
MRLIALLLLSVRAFAATTYYLDPAWTGTLSGTASQPWSNLTSSAWSTINGSLASGAVTVYLSATGNYGTNRGIDVTQRETNTANVLTIDGWSFYNTSTVTPSWVATNGARCVVDNVQSQNSAHAKYSNITLNGLKIQCNQATKEVSICGDNWIVQNCECSHTTNGTSGPGILLVPTSDAAHQGSASYAPVCTNITIQSNFVHDTEGEAIYLGGGGNFTTPTESGAGYPSHGQIFVQYNVISNAGSVGPGQGDGIDVKGGLYQVTIKGNAITALSNTNTIRAIVAQGQTNGATGTNLLISGNYITNNIAISDSCVSLSDSWGVPQGVILRNNVFANNTGPGASGVRPRSIEVQSSQDQVLVQNNTAYNNDGHFLEVVSSSTTIKLRNNLSVSNNFTGNQVVLKGTVDSDYNANSGTWGYASEGAHSKAASISDFASTNTLRLITGSSLIDSAETQTAFADDIIGTSRPKLTAWDIGAYEYVLPSFTFGIGTIGNAQVKQ